MMIKPRCAILLLCLSVCLWLLLPGSACAQEVNVLLARLKQEHNDTARIKILLAISEVCEDKDILQYAGQARDLCNEALSARKQPVRFYMSSLASAINCIGFYYSHKEDPDKALENYKEALRISEQLQDKKLSAYALNNIAFIYSNQGDIAISLDYYYKNLKIQEEIKDTSGIAYSLNNIAHTFMGQEDYKNAMDYFARSLKLFEAIHLKSGTAMVLANIGTIYASKNEGEKALEYYDKSLQLYEEIGDESSIAKVLSSIAFEYAKLGDDSNALSFFYKVLAIASKNNFKSLLSYAYAGIANIMLKRGDMDSARLCATRALAYGKETGDIKDIQKAATRLKDIYVKEGNYKDAYAMHDLEIRMRDSITNEGNRKAIISKRLQYEYDKKALQAKLDNERKIEKKNLVIFCSLLLAGAVAVAAMFYIRHNKLKVSLERMELEQQQYRAQMNPHFIFNCLHSIQHFIVHNDVISANRFLSEFASLMRTTMDNNRLHTIALQQEIEYLNCYLGLEQMRFENKFKYEISCSPEVNTYNIQILPTIIQPFVENAILHGLCYLEKDGMLSISFEKEDAYLVCKVDDNGIGRKASQALKAGSWKTHVSQGMELVRKRLALASSLNKAKYSVEIVDKTNAEGKAAGTLVTLKFPIEI